MCLRIYFNIVQCAPCVLIPRIELRTKSLYDDRSLIEAITVVGQQKRETKEQMSVVLMEILSLIRLYL